MITPCPSCHRRLKVPEGAVGRRARCPACKAKFVVADPDATSFGTIAGFILEEESATQALKEHHRQQSTPTSQRRTGG